MKRFRIPALVLVLASSMFAAPQGNAKKAPPTLPAATATDTQTPSTKEVAKSKAKTKKAPKVKPTHDTHK